MQAETEYIASMELTSQLQGRVEYEIERIELARWVTNRQAWHVLAEQAGRGDWELMRLRRFRDGRRIAWLRRKVIRTRLTIPA